MSRTTRQALAAFSAALLLASRAAAPANAKDLAPTLHPKAAPLPFTHQGPFVTTGDGGVLCVDAQHALHSRDEGQTWTATPIFRDEQKYRISNERALLRTRDGVVIAAWMNTEGTEIAAGLELGREGRGLAGLRAAHLRVPEPRRRKDVGGARLPEQALVRLHSFADRDQERTHRAGRAGDHSRVASCDGRVRLRRRGPDVAAQQRARHRPGPARSRGVHRRHRGRTPGRFALSTAPHRDRLAVRGRVARTADCCGRNFRQSQIKSVTCCAAGAAGGRADCPAVESSAAPPSGQRQQPGGVVHRLLVGRVRHVVAAAGRRGQLRRPVAGFPILICTSASPASCGSPRCKAACA